MNAADGRRYVYVINETAAVYKDSDHVLSYLENFVSNVLSKQVEYLKHYLDSAPYLKYKYVLYRAVEKICAGTVQTSDHNVYGARVQNV